MTIEDKTNSTTVVEKKGPGRPLRDFDKRTFEGLCWIQCTVDEMQKVFHCDHRTLDKWCLREYGDEFSQVYKEYSVEGKISIRRSQFKHMEKSYAMSMYLGKIYLGQREIPVGEVVPNDALMTLVDQLTRRNHQLEAELNALKPKTN